MTLFVRIGYGGHCTQINNSWEVNCDDDGLHPDILYGKNDLVGQLEAIKEKYGEIIVETFNESYKLYNVVPHRFFSSSEDRNLAVFHSVGVPKTETNILRGFKFPFPLSLPIFYGPILAAFIYLDKDDGAAEAELHIDGIALDVWAKIIEGWQDMALIRAGTQTEALKPYWTSDTAITEGALTDVEGALDELSDIEQNGPKDLEIADASSADDDGYSTEGEPDELDIEENEVDDDELEAEAEEDEVDPELVAYCRKTLAEDDEE